MDLTHYAKRTAIVEIIRTRFSQNFKMRIDIWNRWQISGVWKQIDNPLEMQIYNPIIGTIALLLSKFQIPFIPFSSIPDYPFDNSTFFVINPFPHIGIQFAVAEVRIGEMHEMKVSTCMFPIHGG